MLNVVLGSIEVCEFLSYSAACYIGEQGQLAICEFRIRFRFVSIYFGSRAPPPTYKNLAT